jgi:hypothetical protein
MLADAALEELAARIGRAHRRLWGYRGPLVFELVPSTCWGSNVRDIVPRARWNELRRATYRAHDHRCQVCCERPDQPVHCHEHWRYDARTFTQRLHGLLCLCPACHDVMHFGRALRVGRDDEALRHLMRVNGWTREHAERYAGRAVRLFQLRSLVEWSLDVTLIGLGVVLPRERTRWLQHAAGPVFQR